MSDGSPTLDRVNKASPPTRSPFSPFLLNESRLILSPLRSVVQVSLDADSKGEELEELSRLYDAVVDEVNDTITAVLKLEEQDHHLPHESVFRGLGYTLVCTRTSWDLRNRWEWSLEGELLESLEVKFRFAFVSD